MDAGPCWTGFISSSSFSGPGGQTSGRVGDAPLAVCHYFRGHTHLQTAFAASRELVQGERMPRWEGGPDRGGSQLEGRSFKEDLVADTETSGWASLDRMWGRFKMGMMEWYCCLNVSWLWSLWDGDGPPGPRHPGCHWGGRCRSDWQTSVKHAKWNNSIFPKDSERILTVSLR